MNWNASPVWQQQQKTSQFSPSFTCSPSLVRVCQEQNTIKRHEMKSINLMRSIFGFSMFFFLFHAAALPLTNTDSTQLWLLSYTFKFIGISFQRCSFMTSNVLVLHRVSFIFVLIEREISRRIVYFSLNGKRFWNILRYLKFDLIILSWNHLEKWIKVARRYFFIASACGDGWVSGFGGCLAATSIYGCWGFANQRTEEYNGVIRKYWEILLDE